MASEIIWKERINSMKSDISKLRMTGLTEDEIKRHVISIINTYSRQGQDEIRKKQWRNESAT